MNPVRKYIHQKIMEDWENFPWKLDYIASILFSKETNRAYDLVFIENKDNGNFILDYLEQIQENNEDLQGHDFEIGKDELFSYLKEYLGEEQSFLSNHVSIIYTTKIFSQEYLLKTIKSFDVMVFRLILTGKEKNINFNCFNEKLDEYSFTTYLSEKFPSINQHIEKKIKI